jgi:hypothetical protein
MSACQGALLSCPQPIANDCFQHRCWKRPVDCCATLQACCCCWSNEPLPGLTFTASLLSMIQKFSGIVGAYGAWLLFLQSAPSQ